MIGAIIGDIVGSRFEWDNCKKKDFAFLTEECRFTDDTLMSVAIAKAILESDAGHRDLSARAIEAMREFGRAYPTRGYGGQFRKWLESDDPQPYNSYGNGAAMQVSACGFAAETLEEARALSRAVTAVTHNHPEGIKGAEATAAAIFLARDGRSKSQIRDYIHQNYYPMDFTLDGIRDTYTFDVSCQGSVPEALMAFFESSGFEDAIRNAVSIGGDSDTIAAITGGVAEAFYGVEAELLEQALPYLDEPLLRVLVAFENRYGSGKNLRETV